MKNIPESVHTLPDILRGVLCEGEFSKEEAIDCISPYPRNLG